MPDNKIIELNDGLLIEEELSESILEEIFAHAYNMIIDGDMKASENQFYSITFGFENFVLEKSGKKNVWFDLSVKLIANALTGYINRMLIFEGYPDYILDLYLDSLSKIKT